MQTRCYNRSSVLAFPKHCDYACALERPARPYPASFWWGCAAGFIAAVVAGVLQ